MTITAGTDTYNSLVEADLYWEEHNNTTWAAASDEDKEKSLREATVFIDGTYDGKWIGYHPGSTSQIRAWPRNNAVDSEGRDVTGIPDRVKEAEARLALEGLTAFLVPAEERDGRIKSAKVGPLAVEYFGDAAAGKDFKIFLDLYLNGLLRGGGGNDFLSRV